jgi:hypothetical protein
VSLATDEGAAQAQVVDSEASPAFVVPSLSLKAKTETATASATQAGANTKIVGQQAPGKVAPQFCMSFLLSTYKVWTDQNVTRPFFSTAQLIIDSSHTQTLGIGFSVKGTYGSYTPSGSTSTTEGWVGTFQPSGASHYYQLEWQYGNFEFLCDNIIEHEAEPIMETSGNRLVQINWSEPFLAVNCAVMSPGFTYKRSTSGHNHFNLSGGVLSAANIGINLSLDWDYASSQLILYYITTQHRTNLCGNNGFPSVAAQIAESTTY